MYRHLAMIWLVLQAPLIASADVIHFKDGMRTICQEKAWEQDGEVKCEYQGKIIRYPKSDVLRIEKTAAQNPPALKPSAEHLSPPALKTNIAPGTADPAVDGILFYNPRRPDKYWTSSTARHRTLKEAVDALAADFNRSAEWVMAHMGESNDLSEIRRNLTNSLHDTPTEPVKPAVDLSAETNLFYNPRRPDKYWTGKTGRHQTLQEALEALAREYDRSPQWVQTYMGETNDVEQIRRNLNDRKTSESKP